MGKWIAHGKKISLGIYMLLGAIGIGYIIWGIYDSGYEWTKGHTIHAITIFGMFYVLMVLLIRVIMDRKLTKKILLLEIPLAIVIAVGVIASIAFVEEQKIHSLSLFMAVLLVVPVLLSLLRIGYSQWKFYKGES
ncbi:hypothetical protein H9I32_06355 [Bacillus sp. Xin]|uniref:hypothetical protein n=1 Tax=unclassified Bacillus (in: firmicutes) TaxID=185979 RepID=UPI001573ECC5|nr:MULTISPECIES: hypothetical protein [unclassified Bacillus (in: firmicutes)]MBC6972055.1 hypothetical protein [Bacillus sp. Xin]NSW38875.1 hypothetical protein [Bacillus sp. Xin1]